MRLNFFSYKIEDKDDIIGTYFDVWTSNKENEYKKILNYDIEEFPGCCGAYILNSVRELVTEDDERLDAAWKLLFKSIKSDYKAAKLVWADKVDGTIHRKVAELYPNSEVGTPKKNPNSRNKVLIGEINFTDL